MACVGLKEALTGHTLCDAHKTIVLERIEFPTPVISVSIEPKNTKDKESLVEVLSKMARQDPTFRYGVDAETGQTIISGMGELHLEVLTYRLEHDYNVPVGVGRPLVAYREAVITKTAEAEARFIRQTGGRGQYAVVTLRVEPIQVEKGNDAFEFVNATSGVGPAPRVHQRRRAAYAREGMQMGVLAGYEVLNVRATLVDGKEHDVDSPELAFENAGRHAMEEAMKKAGPVLLEPIMKLQVSVPDEYFGAVSGDPSARRGSSTIRRCAASSRVIHAKVPLSELFQYATKLRTLTQGRAGHLDGAAGLTMPMPPALQQDLLRAHGYID